MAAMSFSCCNRTAHFRYLFQKTTANPILDLGMITLPKPLHATRIRASNRGAQGGKYFKLPSGSEQSARESDILELLDDSSKSTTAVDVSKILEEKLVEIEAEEELEHLYTAILSRSHISTMWKIAGAGNNTVRADPILPPDTLSPEKWDGMCCEIKTFNMQSIKQVFSRFFGDRRFRLEGKLEMLICRGNLGIPGVIFLDKSELPSGLLFVEKNPTHPDGARCDFAFKFGNGTELLDQFPQGVIKLGKGNVDRDYQTQWNKALQVVADKGPGHLSHQFAVYIRCIGSNVFVGQAWKAYGNPEIFCGNLLLVKDRKK